MENAILHGIKNISYRGKLEIKVSQQGNQAHILIVINGAELKEKESHKKGSHGTNIIKERLKIFEKIIGEQTSIEIQNRKDTLGTEVHIWVPMG